MSILFAQQHLAQEVAMPQIVIEHDILLNKKVTDRIKETLKKTCSRCFSTNEWTLEPEDFGFKFDFIRPPSESTHNVVVRITLANFPERAERAEYLALMIRNAVLIILHEDVYTDTCDKTTVGVSLVLSQVEWAAGTINDVP